MRILLFFLLTTFLFGQRQFPSIADTSSMKTLDMGDGATISLQGYSASTTSGSGLYIVIDSVYAEGANAFDHPEQGKQWASVDYINISASTSVYNTLITDSLGNSNNVVKYYADTTAMKAETGTGIKQAYITQLGASGVGGGDFIYKASGYTANAVTVFDHATSGYWVRKEWLDNKTRVNAAWGGFAAGNVSTLNSNIMDKVLAVASSESGSVYIENGGVYTIEHRIILNWDGAGLEGNERSQVTLKRSSTFDTAYNWGAGGGYCIVGFVGGISGGFIRDITIDADNKITAGDTGSGNPILLNEVTDIVVERCVVKNITGHTYGIWSLGSKRIKILYNDISGDRFDTYSNGNNNEQEGIEVSQESCEDVIIEGNYSYNLSSNGMLFYYGPSGGISDGGEYVKNLKVINNTVENCEGTGIKATYQFTTLDSLNNLGFKDLLINNNTIRNCGNGVYLRNDVVSTMGYGFTDITVSDNKLISNDQSIYMKDVQQVWFSNNRIYSDSSSFSSLASPYLMIGVSHVELNREKIFNPVSNGIYIPDGNSFVTITNCRIVGAGQTGILVKSNGYHIIRDNYIINCNTAGETVAYTYASGITLSDADRCLVKGNFIIDTRDITLHQYGIYSAFNMDSTIIQDNYVNTAALYEAGTGGINKLRLLNTTFTNWGYVTPTAASTFTQITLQKPSDSGEKIFAVQVVGTDINVRISTGNYFNGFRITHDAAVGTESIFYMIMPPAGMN